MAAAVACFHRHLPLAKLRAGKRVEWDLASPQVGRRMGAGRGGKRAAGGGATSHRPRRQCCPGRAIMVRSPHSPLPTQHTPTRQVSNILYEATAGLVNVWKRPIKGARRGGAVGAVEGAGRGLVDLGYRPAKGLALTAGALARMASPRAHGGRGGGGGEGDEEEA